MMYLMNGWIYGKRATKVLIYCLRFIVDMIEPVLQCLRLLYLNLEN